MVGKSQSGKLFLHCQKIIKKVLERFEKDTHLSVGALPIDKTILKRQGVTRSDGNFYLFRNFDTKKCRVALANIYT